MSEYVQFIPPNAAELKEEINKARGERTMAQFAEDIKLNTPDIKVSASTLSRACNRKDGNPVNLELLQAIALAADKKSGVTIDSLTKANGMKTKEEGKEKIEKVRKRYNYIELEKTCQMIIQNEIINRGYTVQRINNHIIQEDRFFPRICDFGFSISGLKPNVWKFQLFLERFSGNSSKGVIERYVAHSIIKYAAVFASDNTEYELYENEKYSFVFLDKKIYEAFINRCNKTNIKVNGLISIILLDIIESKVIDEVQLERYDGEVALKFFNQPVIQSDEDTLSLFDFDDEE